MVARAGKEVAGVLVVVGQGALGGFAQSISGQWVGTDHGVKDKLRRAGVMCCKPKNLELSIALAFECLCVLGL